MRIVRNGLMVNLWPFRLWRTVHASLLVLRAKLCRGGRAKLHRGENGWMTDCGVGQEWHFDVTENLHHGNLSASLSSLFGIAGSAY